MSCACLVRTEPRIKPSGGASDHTRTETRCFISSHAMAAKDAAETVHSHWAIENRLYCILYVAFGSDLSRLRKGFGALNITNVDNAR